MLKPLFFLKQGSQLDLPEALRSDLSKIVDVAGDLSREMRQCEHVIYFWPPTFKDGK